MQTGALGTGISSACRVPAPAVMAMASGTPALAMFVISSRRVIATSALFLVEIFHGAIGLDSFRAGLLTALETLGIDVGSATQRPCHRAHDRRPAYRYSADRTENRRVSIGRSRQVNGDSFEGRHFPKHAFFGAAHAGNSRPDRPAVGNFIEMARGARGMSERSFAAKLVEAPALAMAFVAEPSRKPAGVEVCPPRAVFVNHALVGELRAANLVQGWQFAHRDVFQNRSDQVVRIGRTTGEV